MSYDEYVYCPQCGTKLIREVYQTGFDVITGKPTQSISLPKCSNQKGRNDCLSFFTVGLFGSAKCTWDPCVKM